jgi:sialic acid synthase SpsE
VIPREIEIAGRKVGDGHQPFIVGEVGMNHNGSTARALSMCAAARDAGCDAVKFGTFRADEFCAKDDPLYSTFKQCELEETDWRAIKDFCDRIGIMFFSTPQNESDMRLLLRVGVPCLKIGSDDLTKLELVQTYAATRLPLILSTGMADELDLRYALRAAWHGQVLVCVCTSEYPCPPAHANLSRLTKLRTILPAHMPTGFSDHTVGPTAAAAAVALGAAYFEKHFTLDNTLPGPDHHFSADPTALWVWTKAIRDAHAALGRSDIAPTEVERAQRDKWRRKTGQQIRGLAA